MAGKRPWHRPQLRRVWMTIRARQVEPTVLTVRGVPVPVLPWGALPDPRDKREGMTLVPPSNSTGGRMGGKKPQDWTDEDMDLLQRCILRAIAAAGGRMRKDEAMESGLTLFYQEKARREAANPLLDL